ncbi:protein Lilipod [Contarinia nasturtii]|uniref:protein Lilipod n=1 Tax=Contarinia nasturtii TaxID=265458 RepID=UPI0012D49567|nr:protein Lilipod [Contarinia nasturtii]XP_031619914.1 protein Lilipod [Contarinia nasturtii]
MEISLDEDDEVTDIREQMFHNTVREQIIFLLLFILLYVGSFALIGRFRRRDREDLCSTDEDEVLVYKISLWLCTFSLAVAICAALLLPISIASNEVLLLYPLSYYVKWLNSSLVHGLWNHVFLFSNLSLFVLLPFSYLFAESSGFFGHRKGIISRAYETFTVFSLLAVVVLGITYVVSAVIYPEKRGLQTLLNLGSYHLPFLYSCVSFLGVLLLLVCTPLGFIRLFGVVGQVLVKPHLMRDVNEEYHASYLEEASVLRKIEKLQYNPTISSSKLTINNANTSSNQPSKYCDINSIPKAFGSLTDSLLRHRNLKALNSICSKNYPRNETNDKSTTDITHNLKCEQLQERLHEVRLERKELDKLRSSTAIQRNLIYPLAMLMLLFLTGLTVLVVVQNMLELLIGIKALPLSTRQFTLGITSLSKVGPIGAAIEVFIIFYLCATSTVGLYTMPFMQSIRPQRHKTSLAQLIVNGALVLILSSALPLLSRILGITNFDLLGDFGEIEWLGNFQIVLLYNVIFVGTTTLCLVNKFTATVRQELCNRLRSLFGYSYYTNFVSHENGHVVHPEHKPNIAHISDDC